MFADHKMKQVHIAPNFLHVLQVRLRRPSTICTGAVQCSDKVPCIH